MIMGIIGYLSKLTDAFVCSILRRHQGSLLWNSVQNSRVFSCAKKGSTECSSGKTLGNFIAALNPALGEAYKRD